MLLRVRRRRRFRLLPIVLVVGAIVLIGGSLRGVLDALFGSTGVHCTDAFCVPDRTWTMVKHCTADQMLNDRRCGDIKIVVISAAKMPFIARNIKLAWTGGSPAELTKNSALQRVNRAKACGGFTYRYPDLGSCDEYPFASTEEGGEGARTDEVHRDEQNCQGGTLSRAYQSQHIGDGGRFLVVISRPDKIPGRAWRGEELQAEQC